MLDNFTIFRYNNDGIINNIYLFCDKDNNESIVNDLNNNYDGIKLKISHT